MGKSKAPRPPDPRETAAAQTGTNVTTALANAQLGNVDQFTPDGSLTYSIDPTRTQTFTDPSNGATYDIPRYTQTVTLSPEQQAIKEQTDAAELNLGILARNQSDGLNKALLDPVSTEGLTERPDARVPSAPTLASFNGNAGLSQYSTADQLGGGLPQASPALLQNFGDAGDITRTYGSDFTKNRDEVTRSIVDRNQSFQDRDLARLQTRLANQGIQQGSEAYTSALDDYQRSVNDFRLGAIQAGGAEHTRLANIAAQQAGFQNSAQSQAFGQAQARGQFERDSESQQFGLDITGSQARDQAIQANIANQRTAIDQENTINQQALDNSNSAVGQNNSNQQQNFANEQSRNQAINNQRNAELDERYGARNQKVNEVSALLSGSQVNNPNFSQTNQPTLPTVDQAGLINENFNQRLGIFNQQQAQRGGVFGGLLGLAGKLGGTFLASDRRVKRNVKKVGNIGGHSLYSYRYKGDFDDGEPHIGVMAQEAEKKLPGAVITGQDGVKRVDYGALFDSFTRGG